MTEDNEVNKRIDESWKEQAEKEKAQSLEGAPSPEANFSAFLSSLFMQALVSLGELPNPLTKEKNVHLNQARYLIDIIGMLKEKTKGNLVDEEERLIDNLLYELRMKYVQKSTK